LNVELVVAASAQPYGAYRYPKKLQRERESIRVVSRLSELLDQKTEQPKLPVAGAEISPLDSQKQMSSIEVVRPMYKDEQSSPDKLAVSIGADATAAMSSVERQGIRAGDRAVVRYLDDNKSATYILSDTQNDPTNGVLSVTSPLGKQLLGHVEGDEIEFEVGGRLRPVLVISATANQEMIFARLPQSVSLSGKST
jgi:transcription elongation GreA/GreB family factor